MLSGAVLENWQSYVTNCASQHRSPEKHRSTTQCILENLLQLDQTCAGVEAVHSAAAADPPTPEVPLEGLTDIEQQRRLFSDLLCVLKGAAAEYIHLTGVKSESGGRHIVYQLSENCGCCSAFIQDTVAKCDTSMVS